MNWQDYTLPICIVISVVCCVYTIRNVVMAWTYMKLLEKKREKK